MSQPLMALNLSHLQPHLNVVNICQAIPNNNNNDAWDENRGRPFFRAMGWRAIKPKIHKFVSPSIISSITLSAQPIINIDLESPLIKKPLKDKRQTNNYPHTSFETTNDTTYLYSLINK